MFIIGWLVILVLRANDVVIPALVSGIVGWLAILEAALYLVILLINIIAFVKIGRKF